MIDKILDKLDKVKKTGSGSYIARCPAHNDGSPSLAVSEKGDTVLLHCFAGCSVADILGELGLTFSDLYPEKAEHSSGYKKPFPARDILDALKTETLLVAIYAERLSRGEALPPEELKRLQLATQRITTAEGIINDK